MNVRELRANLAAVLDRAVAGEAVEITRDGVPVAVVGPVPDSDEDEGEAPIGSLTDAATRQPFDPSKHQPGDTIRLVAVFSGGPHPRLDDPVLFGVPDGGPAMTYEELMEETFRLKREGGFESNLHAADAAYRKIIAERAGGAS